MNSVFMHTKAMRPAMFLFIAGVFAVATMFGGAHLAQAQWDGGGDGGYFDSFGGGGCGDCTAPSYSPDTYTNYYPDTYSNYYPDTTTNYYPDTTTNYYPDTYDYYTPSYDYSTPAYSSYSYPSYGSMGFSVTPYLSYSYPSYHPSYPYPVYTSPSNNTVITNTNTNTNINNTNTNINTVNTATPSYPVYPSYPSYPSYPTCSLTISPGVIGFGQAATLSWSSAYASSGWILNVGNVGPSGSVQVTPARSMTYTATFYGTNGQSVNCSAYVQVGAYANTPYVTLSAVPYTGLELGPVGTTLYWSFLVLWCLFAAYLVAVKRIQNTIASRLKVFLFGGAVAHAASAHEQHAPVSPAHAEHAPAHETHAHAPVRKQEQVDEFIMSQIHRGLQV